MAVAIARQGGLGVIHRNLSIEDQAHQVDVVKRSEAGMVDEPITISPDATIGEADAMCGRYRISGVPVVDRDLRLLGIVTNRDMRFESDPTRLVGDVMTKMPLVTGPVGIAAEDAMAPAGPAQDREAAAGRRPGPAQGPDHAQGLRQVRPVPRRLQGRPGPAPGRCGRRLLRRLLEARDGPGRGGRRPAGGRHRARPLPRRARHGRAGSRPSRRRRRRRRRRQRRHLRRGQGPGRRRRGRGQGRRRAGLDLHHPGGRRRRRAAGDRHPQRLPGLPAGRGAADRRRRPAVLR